MLIRSWTPQVMIAVACTHHNVTRAWLSGQQNKILYPSSVLHFFRAVHDTQFHAFHQCIWWWQHYVLFLWTFLSFAICIALVWYSLSALIIPKSRLLWPLLQWKTCLIKLYVMYVVTSKILAVATGWSGMLCDPAPDRDLGRSVLQPVTMLSPSYAASSANTSSLLS